jgi:hypothetical protein
MSAVPGHNCRSALGWEAFPVDTGPVAERSEKAEWVRRPPKGTPTRDELARLVESLSRRGGDRVLRSGVGSDVRRDRD